MYRIRGIFQACEGLWASLASWVCACPSSSSRPPLRRVESKQQTTAGSNHPWCVCQGFTLEERVSCSGSDGRGFRRVKWSCNTSNKKPTKSLRCCPPVIVHHFLLEPKRVPISGVNPRTRKQASPGLGIRLVDLHYPVYDEQQHFRAAESVSLAKPVCWPMQFIIANTLILSFQIRAKFMKCLSEALVPKLGGGTHTRGRKIEHEGSRDERKKLIASL